MRKQVVGADLLRRGQADAADFRCFVMLKMIFNNNKEVNAKVGGGERAQEKKKKKKKDIQHLEENKSMTYMLKF